MNTNFEQRFAKDLLPRQTPTHTHTFTGGAHIDASNILGRVGKRKKQTEEAKKKRNKLQHNKNKTRLIKS